MAFMPGFQSALANRQPFPKPMGLLGQRPPTQPVSQPQVNTPYVGYRPPSNAPQQQQGGGFPFFPRSRQQPGPWILPWPYTQVANTAVNYGGMLQGAMGQIGAQLNANADRISAARPIQAAYDIDRRGQEYQHEARMAQIANQGRLFDMIGGGMQGLGSSPAGGGINITGGPSMTAQGANQGARDNLYGGLMGGLSQAAFTGTGQIPGFQTPGGEVSARMPTAPWAGGQPGSVQAGIDTTPGRVWNQELADAAKGRLGAFSNRTMPFLNAAPGSAKEGLAGNFRDLVSGLTSRSYNDLTRAGTRAEGEHQLRAQTGASQAQQGLWRLMSQMYQGQLGGDMQNKLLNLRMLQSLS